MIRSILKNVSVSSYKTFKERLSDNGVILSERGQTFSYAFLDANNKQRRARETRLGSNFGRETILHKLENRARQNEFRAFETRFKETDCSSFILISLFLFLDDFDL